MKNILLFIFANLLIVNIASSQVIAPDFTLTNTDGVAYNLYNQLDSGKVVLLCFFSVSCGSCQADVPLIENIYQNNDSNNFTLMPIESYFGTNEQIVEFISTYGGTYKGFSTEADNHVLADSMFNVTYTPQYAVVCPDTTYKKIDVENVQNLIDKCPQGASIAGITPKPVKSEILSISSNNRIKIRYNTINDQKVRFEVIDLLGNTKYTKFANATEGVNELVINDITLKRGYYVLRMSENNYSLDVKKFVVY